MRPDQAAIDLKLMRAASLLDTDPPAAARYALEILQVVPGHRDAQALLATANRHAGDPAAALRDFAALAAAQPESAVLQLELGRAALAAGQPDQALAAQERAVALQPELAEAWRELSRLRAARGDTAGCDAAYARYAALTTPDKHLSEALNALATRRFDAADTLLSRQLSMMPEDVEALHLKARLATEREEYREAERLLEQCLRIEPGYARARFDLAALLHLLQKPAMALPLIDRLLLQEPGNFQFRSLRASACTVLGQTDASIALFNDLLREQPENQRVWLNYGNALRTKGNQPQAIAAYRKCIELAPGFGEAYFCLANLKTFRFTPQDIAAMNAQLLREDLANEDRLYFEFALGKAHEDAAEYAQSFTHYARGNEVRRSEQPYDPEFLSAQVRSSRSVFTQEFFAARAGWGCQAPDPIFVVGLPRSGSTLIEQILSSHSQVEGTRELPEIPAIVHELGARRLRKGEIGYPESVATLSREQAEELGRSYLQQTRPYRFSGRPYFVDKMPNNFMNVGLIHLILPNARIIDARRHPLACGFSNFKQHFQRGLIFSYDLQSIARFYRDYVTQMADIEAVLPGRVHRLHYEHLVANPEQEVRRMLDYCGLPFEAGCLRFHENKRVVQTASSEQVRRPIFSEGLDQWRHYDEWLGPLKEELADLIAAYPVAGS